MFRISASDLEEFLCRLFIKYGAKENESREISSHLVTSNLMGHDSHGVIRAPWYIEKVKKGEIVPGASIEIEKETASSAVVNGNWGFGQPIARHAMELAIKKSKENVLSCITVRNCNHIGRLGAYTSLASDNGMVGIAMANLHGTSHVVAPHGGKEARLPTNPISIAFPSGGDIDFLLDMCTSVVAEGKLKVKLNRGEKLPEEWAIDAEGNPADDPSQFYDSPRGAILPLGGVSAHKGFALSMAIDALSGALSGAQCSNPQAKRHGNACLFIVIRIEVFTPLVEFTEKVGSLIKHVKSAKLADGVDEILIPGEPEAHNTKRCMEEGISIDTTTWGQLTSQAVQVGINPEEYL